MAHLSVYDPPAVGMGNKDKESEETKKEEMPQAVEEVDLEEGEIIDSCGEDNFGESEKVNDSHPCEELDLSDKKKKKKRKKKKKDDDDQNDPEKPPKKKRVKYIDHDRVDEEDDWYPMNPLPYPKKNFSKMGIDGNIPLQLGGFDGDYYSSDLKSSPSQDEDELNEETELQNRKMAWKNLVKRQNNERAMMKKKRKDGLLRGTHDTKKRRMMMQNKNKRKIVKVKQRAPLCKFYLEGRCSKGSDCTFSHATQPSGKKELCKFYVNGYCAKGENCLYMHEEFPCKFFHTGAKCYSEPNCPFSHAPLTEETTRILEKYLESSKVEEENENENTKDSSPQKQQQKRPSLLGSPPRHVKEAAETLKWRQYVSQMQQHQRRFDRYNPQNPLILSHPHMLARPPNFYIDTLRRSPAKIPSLMSMPPIAMPPLNPNLPIPPMLKMPGIYSKIPEGESSSQEEWENNAECHKRNDIKNDKNSNTPNTATDTCVTQSTTAEPVSNSTVTEDHHEAKDTEKVMNNADSVLAKEKEVKVESIGSADTDVPPEHQMANSQQTANSPPTDSMLPLPPPLVIPTHLPRRQRELYLRIQQHQKEADSGTDVSEDPEGKAEEEKSENWYSSDEDDTEDQPLTAVLKKLQQTPLPNASQSIIPTTPSTIDIAKMLTEIRQQATQKSVSNNGSNTTNQQKDFWQSLLSGAAPTTKDPRSNTAAEHFQAQNKPESRDPRIRSNSTSADSAANTSPPSRDPRLQRDPRLAVRDPRVTSSNGPNNNLVVAEGLAIQLPLPPPPWEGHSAVIKTNNVVTEKVKSAGNAPVPYKLRSITVSQPNYSSYVFACQSNPKLLNDPRLKKYFKQMSGLLRQQQHLTEDVKSFTPIRDSKSQFEGQSKAFVGKDEQEETVAVSDAWDRLQKSRTADPRIAKIPLNVPRPTGSTTPPLPPATTLAPDITPTSTPSINTSVMSHLPKSVTDPRLTRLLHQPEHRRPISSCDQNPSVNKPLPLQRKLSAGNIRCASSNVTSLQLKQSSVTDSQSCQSGNDSPKPEEISTECPTAEKEKKKKLTSYNRKSSMDYASPLSSYEDTSNNNSYSSYNRRPQPSQTTVTSTVAQPNIPQPPKSVSPVDIKNSLQESSSHNQTLSFLSNETSAETVVVSEHTPSLKEVFKTIDPTASPFCSI